MTVEGVGDAVLAEIPEGVGRKRGNDGGFDSCGIESSAVERADGSLNDAADGRAGNEEEIAVGYGGEIGKPGVECGGDAKVSVVVLGVALLFRAESAGSHGDYSMCELAADSDFALSDEPAAAWAGCSAAAAFGGAEAPRGIASTVCEALDAIAERDASRLN